MCLRDGECQQVWYREPRGLLPRLTKGRRLPTGLQFGCFGDGGKGSGPGGVGTLASAVWPVLEGAHICGANAHRGISCTGAVRALVWRGGEKLGLMLERSWASFLSDGRPLHLRHLCCASFCSCLVRALYGTLGCLLQIQKNNESDKILALVN